MDCGQRSDGLLMLCLNGNFFIFTEIDLHVHCPIYIVAVFMAVRICFVAYD